MAKRLLVPVTPQSESLIALVVDLARGAGTSVRLLHVAAEPDNVVTDDGRVVAYADQELTRLKAEGLDCLGRFESQFGDIPVESVVRFGDPVGEILREADSFDADLIAVATRCRSSLKRGLLGSVAETLMRRTELPVLLLRPAESSSGSLALEQDGSGTRVAPDRRAEAFRT